MWPPSGGGSIGGTYHRATCDLRFRSPGEIGGAPLIAWIPLIVAIAGLLAWALASNGNVKTIGLALFTAGSAATLVVAFGARALRIL